jgi:HEAT repeat protein
MNVAMRLAWILFGAAMFIGCGKSDPPLADGRPISHWIQAVKDPNEKLRLEAIAKLGNVGNTDPEVLPILIAALKDRDLKVRCEAILALVKYGPGADAAIAPLAAIQSLDSNPKVREYAAKAVQKLSAAGSS